MERKPSTAEVFLNSLAEGAANYFTERRRLDDEHKREMQLQRQQQLESAKMEQERVQNQMRMEMMRQQMLKTQLDMVQTRREMDLTPEQRIKMQYQQQRDMENLRSQNTMAEGDYTRRQNVAAGFTPSGANITQDPSERPMTPYQMHNVARDERIQAQDNFAVANGFSDVKSLRDYLETRIRPDVEGSVLKKHWFWADDKPDPKDLALQRAFLALGNAGSSAGFTPSEGGFAPNEEEWGKMAFGSEWGSASVEKKKAAIAKARAAGEL